MTPRANFSGGSATPRSGHSYSSSRSHGGSGERRDRPDSGAMFPPPSPAGGARPAHKSKGGALWGQVVQDNRGQERQDARRSGGGGQYPGKKRLNIIVKCIFQVTTLARPTMMTGARPGTVPLEAGRPVRGQGAGAGPQGREGAVARPRTAEAGTGSRGRPEATMVTPRPFTMSDSSPDCRLINCSIVLCIIILLSTLLNTVSTSIFLNTLQHPRIYRVNFILGYFKYM